MKTVQIPHDLFENIVRVLMELPAKNVFVLMKRIETEMVPIDPSPEAPPRE
tara:strand:- start:8980 stop:9132 length:153 start_codon:yes stop_codon:yes gene_type:complete